MRLLKETPLLGDRAVLFIHRFGKGTYRISTLDDPSDLLSEEDPFCANYEELREFFGYLHPKRSITKVSIELISQGLKPSTCRGIKKSSVRYYSYENVLRRWNLSPEMKRRQEIPVSAFDSELLNSVYDIKPDTIYRLRINVYS